VVRRRQLDAIRPHHVGPEVGVALDLTRQPPQHGAQAHIGHLGKFHGRVFDLYDANGLKGLLVDFDGDFELLAEQADGGAEGRVGLDRLHGDILPELAANLTGTFARSGQLSFLGEGRGCRRRRHVGCNLPRVS